MLENKRFTDVIYRGFEAVFFLLFMLIVVLVIFFNRDSFYEFDVFNLLVCSVLGVLAFGAVFFAVRRIATYSLKTEIVVVMVLFILFAVLQFTVGWAIRVHTGPVWDFGVVYSFAEDFVKNGTLPDEYFSNFSVSSGNTALYHLFCGMFTVLNLLGIENWFLCAVIVNIVFIDITLIFVYLISRRLMGKGCALFTLLLSFGMLPFIGYVPIIYTDTLSMPYIVVAAYLYLEVRQRLKDKCFRSAALLYLAVVAICVMGYLLKPTVAILFIATVIDILLMHFGKKQLLIVLGSFAVMMSCVYLINVFIQNSRYLPDYSDSSRVPLSHWVMMGLKGDGGYNDEDIQYTLGFSGYDERLKANMEEIHHRIDDMGVSGLIEHILRKLSYTFGDGSFTVPSKLDRGAVEPNALHEFLVPTGKHFKYTAYATFAIAVSTYFWLAMGSFAAFKNKDFSATFLRVAIFGLVLFLMLAETRSRYLVNFLPIMIVGAGHGIFSIKQFNVFDKIRFNFRRKEIK